MESSKVHLLELHFPNKVSSIRSVVSPIFVAFDVEFPLASPGDQVILVNGLDVCTQFLDPFGHNFVVTGSRARQISRSISSTAWLIGQLPGKDRGRVLISADECFGVLLECIDDLGVCVEVVVVFSTEIDGIHVLKDQKSG